MSKLTLLTGKWRYRSFPNVLPPAKNRADIPFGEGRLLLAPDSEWLITNSLLSLADGFPVKPTGLALVCRAR